MKSMGTKLALQITLVFILVMVAYEAFNVYQQNNILTSRLQAKEERSLQQLSLILGSLLFTMDRNQIDNVVRSYLTDPDVLAIKMLEEDTVVKFLGKSKSVEKPIDLTQEEVKLPRFSNSVTKNAQLTYNNEELGTVEVVFSRQLLIDQLQGKIIEVVGIFLFVITFQSLVVMTIVRKKLTKPMLDLVQAALKIAEGDVDIHLKKISSRDEIGTLSAAFETMITYIRNMAKIATNISTGDFSQVLTPRSDKDVLGRAFQHMSAYLNEMAAVAEKIAGGDLTVHVPVRSEVDAFGRAMSSMTTGLRSLIQQIRNSAKQTGETSKNIATLADDDITIVQSARNSVEEMGVTMTKMGRSVEEVAQNMDTLSSAVEKTSASISVMTSSISDIASYTNQLAEQTKKTIAALETAVQALKEVTEKTDVSQELSQETIREALEGQKAVEQVRASMDLIEQTNTQAVATITRFEQRSQEIGTILDVISQISGQSSLLSLNASIIAAQAGAHGKGFAVIADEMRSLADQVGVSAKNIAAIVQTVQEETTEVVKMIHEATTSIKQGVQRTQFARKMLQEIISSAERSSTMVTDIAKALQLQMKTSQEVMKDMERVYSMMNEANRATNEHKTSTFQINETIEHISEKASQTQQTTTQQLGGVEHVLKAVETVKQLTEQNLASSEEIDHTSGDLAAQAQLLLQSVNRFKLK